MWKPKPLMLTGTLVPGFEIFAEYVNGVKKVVDEETIVDELVLAPESDEDIIVAELKEATSQEEDFDICL